MHFPKITKNKQAKPRMEERFFIRHPNGEISYATDGGEGWTSLGAAILAGKSAGYRGFEVFSEQCEVTPP